VRAEFREITAGWMLIDGMDDLTERIERAAEWTKGNGPLEADEQATISLMIETQIARGFGDREPRMCEGCTAGEHWRCGMQTWCECECDGTSDVPITCECPASGHLYGCPNE